MPHCVRLHLNEVDRSVEVRDWCIHQFGDDGQEGGGRWVGFYDWNGYIAIHFRDQEDAAMCRMAWE